MLKSKTKTNPVFWPVQAAATLAEEPERFERLRSDPANVDLLTWNVFTGLDTHDFPERLAFRLRSFGGSAVRPPIRLSLWNGRTREPLLRPGEGYLEEIRRRAAEVGGDRRALTDFEAPVEVPVLIESPDVLWLVDTTIDTVPRGNGGRERIVELVDVGLDHARRLGKSLAVAIVYASGSRAAAEVSERVNELRDPAALAETMRYRRHIPSVVLREVTWQSLLRAFEEDLDYLHLDGQPVRRFMEHTRALGLR